MAPPAGRLDVLQVLLDVPERVSAGLQLGHLLICQGHVDHASHAPAVQHAGQTQVNLVSDPVHALLMLKHIVFMWMDSEAQQRLDREEQLKGKQFKFSWSFIKLENNFFWLSLYLQV